LINSINIDNIHPHIPIIKNNTYLPNKLLSNYNAIYGIITFVILPKNLIYADDVPLIAGLNFIGHIVSIYEIVDVATKHNIPINKI